MVEKHKNSLIKSEWTYSHKLRAECRNLVCCPKVGCFFIYIFIPQRCMILLDIHKTYIHIFLSTYVPHYSYFLIRKPVSRLGIELVIVHPITLASTHSLLELLLTVIAL